MNARRLFPFSDLRRILSPGDGEWTGRSTLPPAVGGGTGTARHDPGIEGLGDEEWHALIERIRAIASDGEPPPAA
jgi:hypothetical protein